MKNSQIVAALATSPGKAFAELNERPRAWFPLLLTVIATGGITAWFYTFVDFSWLVDQILSSGQNSSRMTDAQRLQTAAFLTRGVLMGASLIAIPIFVVGARLLEAVYYLLAGNLTGVQKPFKNWFALSCWTSLPGLISIVPAALILLLSDSHQISSSAMAPLSLNELFFHKGMAEPGFNLLTALTLVHPVIWGLTVVGVQAWSGRSWLFGSVFSLLPPLLVYGSWAAFALR